MLGNYAKSLAPANAVAKRWAGWFPPIPAGLMGPVSLAVESRDEAHSSKRHAKPETSPRRSDYFESRWLLMNMSVPRPVLFAPSNW
jgi:hypothetical protein